jgi:hypothetical protein
MKMALKDSLCVAHANQFPESWGILDDVHRIDIRINTLMEEEKVLLRSIKCGFLQCSDIVIADMTFRPIDIILSIWFALSGVIRVQEMQCTVIKGKVDRSYGKPRYGGKSIWRKRFSVVVAHYTDAFDPSVSDYIAYMLKIQPV